MIDLAEIMTKAALTRSKLGQDESSPIDIFARVRELDKMTLLFYPMGENISGMCVKGKDNKCIIAVNSMMTQGRQKFSVAHELYHYYYDGNAISVCGKSIGSGEDIEKEADAFAAQLLMPRVAFVRMTEKLLNQHEGKLILQDLIRIEQYFGVSHKATLYQLYNCKLMSKKEMEKWLMINIREEASKNGVCTDVYCASPENKQYMTYGYYIEQVQKCLEKELISDGKYDELLLDAFRVDLVYGIDESGELID